MKIVSCSPIFFHNVVVKCLHCILDLSYINLCRLVSPCRLRVAIQAIIDMVIIWQYCVYGFFPEMFLKPASALYEIKNPFVLGVCVCVVRRGKRSPRRAATITSTATVSAAMSATLRASCARGRRSCGRTRPETEQPIRSDISLTPKKSFLHQLLTDGLF